MRTTRDPPAVSWREDSLKEFQTIYQEVYGEVLEEDELEEVARYLLNLYVSVYGNPKKVIANNKTNYV